MSACNPSGSNIYTHLNITTKRDNLFYWRYFSSIVKLQIYIYILENKCWLVLLCREGGRTANGDVIHEVIFHWIEISMRFNLNMYFHRKVTFPWDKYCEEGIINENVSIIFWWFLSFSLSLWCFSDLAHRTSFL